MSMPGLGDAPGAACCADRKKNEQDLNVSDFSVRGSSPRNTLSVMGLCFRRRANPILCSD